MKVLIVGYGSSGQRYFKILKKNYPFYALKVFSFTKKNKNFIKQFKEIKKFNPDLTILCNAPSKRVLIFKYLSKLKTKVLIEKPIASNLNDSKKIYRIAIQKKIITAVAYNMRFLSSLILFKKKLKSIGKINFVRCEVGQYLPNWRKFIKYENSVSSLKKLGGGVINELSHEIDYLQWIFGKLHSVFCDSQKRSQLNINVEDTANILFLLKNKTPINLSLDFCRRDRVRQCYVSGKKTSLKWDGIQNKVYLFDKSISKWKVLEHYKQSTENTVFLQLKKILLMKKVDYKSIKSALSIASIIKKIKISSKTKKFIKII